MKITHDESNRAAQIAPTQALASVSKTGASPAPYQGLNTPAPAAQVELSAQAQALSASKAEAAQYLPAVQATPDTRDDLVSKLKTQVESGSYHVSSTDIADQILRRSAADRLQ